MARYQPCITITIWEAARSQPIPANFGTSSEVEDVINSTKFHLDWFRDFSLVCNQISHVSKEKQGRRQHFAYLINS